MKRIYIIISMIIIVCAIFTGSCKKQKVRPNGTNEMELLIAIENHDNKNAFNIINSHIDLNNSKYALHAAKTGNKEVLNYLLSKGASVENGPDGFTFLMALSAGGLVKEVKELLSSSNKDINKKTVQGLNAVEIALLNGKSEIVKLLLEYKAEVEPKTLLLCSRDFHSCKYILEERTMNLNITDEKGDTPLIIAVSSGEIEVVKLLIKKGASVEHKNLKEKTAMDILNEKCSGEVEYVGSSLSKERCEDIKMLLRIGELRSK